MKALGENVEGIDNRREKKSRLQHDLPHLIQIAIAQEQYAGGEREADDHRDQCGAIGGEAEDGLCSGRMSHQDKERHDHDGEDAERNQRI